MKANNGLIHKYFLNGMYILIDINSGAVYKIDKITYDVLEYYPKKQKQDVINLLSDRYNSDEIEEIINEIDSLILDNQLFTKNNYNDINITDNSVVKAMCLHISHDCNIRCKYCFASQGDFCGDRMLMSEDVGKKAIDYLIKHSGKRKNLEVDFFGGEPLMNFSVVESIVKYARELEKKNNKHFRFTITTNGTLLNEENMKFINDNMDNVVLSLDGRKNVNDNMRFTVKGSGTYDVILPKIKRMVELRGKKDYYVRGTYTKYNIDFSKDVLHMADCGFKNISVEPVVAKPNNDYALTEENLQQIINEYEELAKEYLKRKGSEKEFDFFHFMIDLDEGPCIYKRISGCGAGNDYVAITPDGDIYPCHQFVGDEKFRLGNVEGNQSNNTLRKEFQVANLTNKEDCKECWAKYYCGGGCLANAYNFNEDICKPFDLGCKLEKKRIECAIMIKVFLQELKENENEQQCYN